MTIMSFVAQPPMKKVKTKHISSSGDSMGTTPPCCDLGKPCRICRFMIEYDCLGRSEPAHGIVAQAETDSLCTRKRKCQEAVAECLPGHKQYAEPLSDGSEPVCSEYQCDQCGQCDGYCARVYPASVKAAQTEHASLCQPKLQEVDADSQKMSDQDISMIDERTAEGGCMACQFGKPCRICRFLIEYDCTARSKPEENMEQQLTDPMSFGSEPVCSEYHCEQCGQCNGYCARVYPAQVKTAQIEHESTLGKAKVQEVHAHSQKKSDQGISMKDRRTAENACIACHLGKPCRICRFLIEYDDCIARREPEDRVEHWTEHPSGGPVSLCPDYKSEHTSLGEPKLQEVDADSQKMSDQDISMKDRRSAEGECMACLVGNPCRICRFMIEYDCIARSEPEESAQADQTDQTPLGEPESRDTGSESQKMSAVLKVNIFPENAAEDISTRDSETEEESCPDGIDAQIAVNECRKPALCHRATSCARLHGSGLGAVIFARPSWVFAFD